MPRRKPAKMPLEVKDMVELLQNPVGTRWAPEEEARKKAEAARNLGKIRHASAVPALLKELPARDRRVEEAVFTALGSIRDKRAIPKLIKALKRGQARSRGNAAEALGMIRDDRAVPHLIRELDNLEMTTMPTVAIALGNIRHPSAIPALLKATHYDYHPLTRDTATQALVKIGWALQRKKAESKEAKALKLVGAYFNDEDEYPQVVRQAYEAALKGEITKDNARLYVKQLRAIKGSLK